MQIWCTILVLVIHFKTKNIAHEYNIIMNIKKLFGTIKIIIVNAFKGFSDDKVTKLSGSLAYSTVFSLAPLLVVIIAICGLFFKKEAIEGKIYSQLAGFVGSDTAMQLQELIKSASLNGKSSVAIIVGVVTLLIGSTAVFGEIQDSINTIWGLKAKPKKGWLKMLQNRLLSFSVIISLGFLLLVSLTIGSLIDGFSDRLITHFPNASIVFVYVVNTIITLSITTIIFCVIFKVLPDAHIKWKDVFIGALITAMLFMLGKFGISYYITKARVGSTYGAAGSLVILLLWVYYSSIILYFGAELTKAYAIEVGSPILPNSYAVTVKILEEEYVNKTIQATSKE